jgi:small subunit ribosomal protein S1
VVTFGAFVEIMDGVEGLVHISELAHHHVENPREVVEPDQEVKVKILEIDSERRRLSLSVKRLEPAPEGVPLRDSAGAPGGAQGAGELGDVPELGLSEDVFAGPQIEGAEGLRAAVAEASAAEEAPPLTDESPSETEPAPGEEGDVDQDDVPVEEPAPGDTGDAGNGPAEPEQDEPAS